MRMWTRMRFRTDSVGVRSISSPAVRLAVVETAQRGGLLHYAFQLADGLARQGHAVELIVPTGNELADRRGAAVMRAVLPAPVPAGEASASRVSYAMRRARVAGRVGAQMARLLWELGTVRRDAVILNYDLALSLVGAGTLALTALPQRPALAVVCHNVRPFNRWGGEGLHASSRLLHGLLGRLYRRLDLVLVHGEGSRHEFEQAWSARRVAVIPHGDEGIFTGEPPPPSAEERVLFFGDLRKVKGLAVLLQAFDELTARRPQARLTIAGTPAPRDWDPTVLREWAAGRAEQVQLIDRYVPFEDVPGLFARARVVATPYLVGYQSGVVHLAMTMARPVVASAVGDLQSVVVDGETGRLCPPGDARALAAALEEVLADPERAARMGAAGRRRLLETASWEKVAERVDAELRPTTPAGKRRRF